MSKMTRKLFLSILAVVLTVFALGSTTFAWFTLTNSAEVEAFEAEIIASSGIEFAINTGGDPEELAWKTTLKAEDIEAYIVQQYTTFLFSDVTSSNGTSFSALSGDASFLTIPLLFRSDNVDEIYWSAVELVGENDTFTTRVPFTNEHNADIEANGSFTVNPADAFRISMVGEIDASANVEVYENPEAGTNVVLGGITDSAAPATGAVAYYEAVSGGKPLGSDSITVPSTITTLGTGVHVLDLVSNENYGKLLGGDLTINIWFEGWDPNAYDSLLGLKIKTSFNFTGVDTDA